MSVRNYRVYFFLCCILVLFFFVLLSGCVGNPAKAQENGVNTSISQNNTTGMTGYPDNSSVVTSTAGTGNSEVFKSDSNVSSTLDQDWKSFRIINLDLTTRYLTLDLSKSEDINYLRYTLIPETTDNISAIRSNLETLQPVTEDQQNETRTLILMTNYTILKYQTLSEMLHATQYANMRDPVMLKSEIRNARLSVMEALDLVNSADIGTYPSEYRDQIAADKRDLDDMMSQIDSYTRLIYQTPTD